MLPRDHPGSTLSSHRAFVVHLVLGDRPGRRRFRGRVEHLSSGQVAPFTSLRALLAFWTAVLDAQRHPVPPPAAKRRRPMRTKPIVLRSIALALALAGLATPPAASAEDLHFDVPAVFATAHAGSQVTTRADADFYPPPLVPKARYAFARNDYAFPNLPYTGSATAQATTSVSAFAVMAYASTALAVGEAYLRVTVTDPQQRAAVKVKIKYKASASSAGEGTTSVASWRFKFGLPIGESWYVRTGADGTITSVQAPRIFLGPPFEAVGLHGNSSSNPQRNGAVHAYVDGLPIAEILGPGSAVDRRSIDLDVSPNLGYIMAITAGASGGLGGTAVAVLDPVVEVHPDNPDIAVHVDRLGVDPTPRLPLAGLTPEQLAAAGLDVATLQQMGFFEPLTPAAPTFADVPSDHPFFAWIEALAGAEITGGCDVNPRRYCPDHPVTRGQLAVFLVRGLHGAKFQPPPPTGMVFQDVPAGHVFAEWIEQLAHDGLTGGCAETPSRYCPDDVVTREQMAVLLLRAAHGAGYQPPAATGAMFGDVPAADPFAGWIEQLAFEGITGGCSANPRLYCPDETVTREQMAAFLVRTFALPLGRPAVDPARRDGPR